MTDDLYAGVDRVVYWLDSRNGRGDHELTARILKIAEEFGEATQAWIGHLGQNPRKGRTNTRTVVADELADVVVTALVAMRSLGFHPSVILADKARALAERITADDSPIWAGCERHPDRLSGRDCPDCATQTALITAGDYEPLVCVACDKPITGRVIGSSPDDDIYHPECHTRDEFPGGDR